MDVGYVGTLKIQRNRKIQKLKFIIPQFGEIRVCQDDILLY